MTRWSILFAAGGTLLLFVGTTAVRETYGEWKVDQEIQGIKAQVEALEGKKLQLSELADRIHSMESLDKEARAKFGLRKPGESVVVVRGFDAYDAAAFGNGDAPQGKAASRSNPQKWFSYFFSHE
jgi:hypothetical protein